MSLTESLRAMLLCKHPIQRRSQLLSSTSGVQWCADCGAMRWLDGGGTENPWQLCDGMESVKSELITKALEMAENP